MGELGRAVGLWLALAGAGAVLLSGLLIDVTHGGWILIASAAGIAGSATWVARGHPRCGGVSGGGVRAVQRPSRGDHRIGERAGMEFGCLDDGAGCRGGGARGGAGRFVATGVAAADVQIWHDRRCARRTLPALQTPRTGNVSAARLLRLRGQALSHTTVTRGASGSLHHN